MKTNLNKRLLSMFVDHVILSVVIYFTSIICENVQESFLNTGDFIFILGIFLYTNKDFFGGRSLSKRLFSLQIACYNSELRANSFQCFLRNIMIVIWPIEVLFVFINPNRRLGDRIAKTEVVGSDIQLKNKRSKRNFIVVLFTLLVSLSFSILLNEVANLILMN